jgi:hypothetical protein
MATTQEYLLGSVTTLMSTELNSLATSSGLTAGAISSVGGSSGIFDNTAGGGGLGGYVLGRIELVLGAPAGTLTTGTAAYIWFVREADGTNYEDGGSSTIPARPADVVIPVRAVSTAQRIDVDVVLPFAKFYVLLAHNTGQTWAASANTLKVLPATYQSV